MVELSEHSTNIKPGAPDLKIKVRERAHSWTRKTWLAFI
jgi:hypothetical protein